MLFYEKITRYFFKDSKCPLITDFIIESLNAQIFTKLDIMYFNSSISHRPCPPSPRTDFNKSRPNLRVYNPNTSLKSKHNNSQLSLNDSSSDESPITSPQYNFTVQKMTISISPRSPRFQSSSTQNDIFNTAYYKRHKSGPTLDESGSNPYFPVQPITDEKIDQIKAILKMSFLPENKDNSNENSFELSVVDDKEIDNLLTRIESHVQTLAPKYFQSSASLIPSTPASSTNSLSSSHRNSSKNSQVSSPRTPRRLSNESSSNYSFSGFQSLQPGNDFKPKKKLRISRSPSADIEKYHIIDKNGHDEIDRRIIELKGKLNKIAELVKARNSGS